MDFQIFDDFYNTKNIIVECNRSKRSLSVRVLKRRLADELV